MVGGVHSGESRRVVLDGRSAKGLASAWWVKRVQLVGRIRQRANFAGTPEAPKRREGGGLPEDGPLICLLW